MYLTEPYSFFVVTVYWTLSPRSPSWSFRNMSRYVPYFPPTS